MNMHRSSTLLNVQLSAVVTGLRFGERIVVADAGLPVPRGVPTLDLALTAGLPTVPDVVRVLREALVIEEAWVAEEMSKVNGESRAKVAQLFDGTDLLRDVPHQDIEDSLPAAKLIVQTGDVTPYGNVVLVGGLDFFELGMAD
jgi:D-ribose pyranase